MSKLEDLGEKEVVSRILMRLESEVALGPGDDAAALDMGDFYLVISTDLVSVGSHSPEGMSDRQLGWMVAAVNFSDIAAMGAEPLGMVLAMALPRDLEVDRAMDMIEGADQCSRLVGASLLGGDTKEGSEVVLVGSALGKVEKGGILTRGGAQPGDLLAVSGEIGLAAAGFLAVGKGIDFPAGRKALMEPVPHIADGRILSRSGWVTSCVDISDGLAHSIHLISQSSRVFFEVDWESIPVGEGVVDIAKKEGVDLSELVLYFGGDYQLLFTLNPDGLEELRYLLPGMRIIGRALRDGENILTRGPEIQLLENRGWEHFGRYHEKGKILGEGGG